MQNQDKARAVHQFLIAYRVLVEEVGPELARKVAERLEPKPQSYEAVQTLPVVVNQEVQWAVTGLDPEDLQGLGTDGNSHLTGV